MAGDKGQHKKTSKNHLKYEVVFSFNKLDET